ncbi:MAG: formylglycine-generating enzyme family protein [Candidatus Omnitrophica bacterium]|nr:formylglycine-generating enzyme family protein [Candidatus Omnitrophota bacterium]
MKKIGLFVFILLGLIILSLYVQPDVSASELTTPEIILVPAGTFQMGSEEFYNAKPIHEVTLTNDFYIGKYEITNQQYAAALNYAWSKGYLNKDELSEKAKRRRASGVSKSPQPYQDVFDEDSGITFEDGVFRTLPGRENLPVVEVTWHGAAFYCNMLSEQEGLTPLYNLDDWSCQVYGKTGYRLPTEAEWEYAAQYDDARKFPWGNEVIDDTRANQGNKDKASPVAFPVSVGSFSPKGDSKLGISDMAGNVAEWCNDWYTDYYYNDLNQTDPVGAGKELFFNAPVLKTFFVGKVLRGGSFLMDPNFRKGMGAPFITDTVIHPNVYNNQFRSYDYLSRNVEGFRVVKTVATDKTEEVFSSPDK